MDINNNSQYTNSYFLKIVSPQVKCLNIRFENCNFENCNFLEATFQRCIFLNCTFLNCDLSVIKVTNSKFIDVVFKDSKVISVNWTLCDVSTFPGTLSLKFNNCLLNFSSFFGMKLKNIEIIDCVAHELDFEEADLTNAILTNTDFEGSKFQNTNLTRADLTLAKNYSINPKSNILKKAKFSLPEAITLLSGLDIIIE